MKKLALVCFYIALFITLACVCIEGYGDKVLYSLGITILCYLFYLGEKIDEIKGE